MMPIRRSLATLLVALALLPAAALANTPFDEIVVFGDSLSDDGNLFAASSGAIPPSPPYANGRFSNGPVWVELLPGLLDPDAPPAQDNWAWGGAHTSATNPASGLVSAAVGMQTSVANYIAANPSASATTLFVLWGGANDYFSGATMPTTPGLDGPVDNIAAQIAGLAATGATTFLVPNLPDLGMTPGGVASGNAAALSAITAAHNAALAVALDDLRTNLGVEIVELDIAALFADVVANPVNYGFANVVAPCFVESGPSLCPNPDDYVFWDDIHPTAAAHQAIAYEAALLLPGALAAEDWALYE